MAENGSHCFHQQHGGSAFGRAATHFTWLDIGSGEVRKVWLSAARVAVGETEPAESGPPVLFSARLATIASHSCRSPQNLQPVHTHQAFFLLPALTSSGRALPLCVGCHSCTRRGKAETCVACTASATRDGTSVRCTVSVGVPLPAISSVQPYSSPPIHEHGYQDERTELHLQQSFAGLHTACGSCGDVQEPETQRLLCGKFCEVLAEPASL